MNEFVVTRGQIEEICEKGKVPETYISAARSTLLSILPGNFTSKDMETEAVKIFMSLRTVEPQVRRAV